MQRILVLRVLLLLIVMVLIGRLYQLQLVDSDTRRYGSTVEDITTRYIPVLPRRGEILARDGTTLLAESVPIFSIAVLPGYLPARGSVRRTMVLGQLAQLSEHASTLIVSPASALQQNPDLRYNLSHITTDSLVYASPPRGLLLSSDVLTLTVPADRTLDAIRMAEVYSNVLTLKNPIEDLIDPLSVARYQTVVVKEDISQELALAVRENSMYLPGVVVVQDYRRRYPTTAYVPSLSHILGYIGRINACELVIENPATSWLTSLMDTMSHIPDCGILPKQIDPSVLARGMPPYQRDDRIGKYGLERGYEAELRGEMGIDTLTVDNVERPVGPIRTEIPVRNGSNLILTIDLEFQHQVELIMQRWLVEGEERRQRAIGHKREYPPITNGVAVALDPHTGQVLAMVSLPTYDNNIWVDPTRSAELQNILSPADPEAQQELARLAPLTNRAIAGQYPPGSSLKQFVGAAVLQHEIIRPETRLYDPGVLLLREAGGTIYELPNSSRRHNGSITISDALMVSSNVFFASITGGNDQAINLRANDLQIRGLGIERLSEGLGWFGFGKPTGIKMAGEAAGRVPTPSWKAYTLREPWTTGDTYNMSIGQGYLEVTPLQMAVATAALVNEGILYRPQLVQAISDSSGAIIETIEPEELSRIPIDPGYLAVMREGLRRSVTEGINVAARDICSGIPIAGKTGTAEYGGLIFTPTGQITRRSHAWFVGFAPYDDPQIVVVVLLEGTGDLDDGSSTMAVPAVTQIMQAYFNVTPPESQPWNCPTLPVWQETVPAEAPAIEESEDAGEWVDDETPPEE